MATPDQHVILSIGKAFDFDLATTARWRETCSFRNRSYFDPGLQEQPWSSLGLAPSLPPAANLELDKVHFFNFDYRRKSA